MSGKKIKTLRHRELIVSLASQNPVLITDTGGIDLSLLTIYPEYAPAIYGKVQATITNLGSVQSDVITDMNGQVERAAGIGVELMAGGTLINGSASDTSALIAGNYDGVVADGSSPVEIVNFGTITCLGFANSDSLLSVIGIRLQDGTIINGSETDRNALIAGGYLGGINSFGSIDVENFGTVTGTNFGGIILEGFGGYVLNGTSLDQTAVIQGDNGYGVGLLNALLVNFGTIIGGINTERFGHYGLDLQNNSRAVNYGTIDGFVGVAFDGAGQQTLVNDGVVKGVSGIAVTLEGGHNLLIVDPGAVFEGLVESATFEHSDTFESNVLELGSAAAAGILDGIGTSFINFGTISFASGASWTIEGDVAGLAGQQTIENFHLGDTIVLDGFSETSYNYVSGTGLELIDNASTITLNLTGLASPGDLAVNESAGNTTISLSENAPCFVAGTRILTPRGHIAVERLQVGECVITLKGEDKPIIWIGWRKIDLSRHPHPEQARPICIAANAFDDTVPESDLLVSPDHAFLFDGHLIPAKALVNDASIYQMKRDSVHYFHIELQEHEIIFAQNAPVETYLESGNRAAFENGGGARILHPDLGQVIRDVESCAPFAASGPVVERVRMRLMRRYQDASWLAQSGYVRRRLFG